MVVHDFDVFGSSRCPSKAEAELLIDSDAVLTLSVSFQRLEAVSWRNAEILQAPSDLELSELPTGDRFDVHESLDPLSASELLRI